MANWRLFALALALAAGGALAARASAPAFAVKPGLWEMTMSGTHTGAPPIPAETLARMTPEQRTRFEAAMRAAIARGLTPRLIKNCVTAEELRRLPHFAQKEGKACRNTVLKRTAREIEFHLQCSGRQNMSGTIDYRAPTPERVAGSVDLTTSDGVHTMRIKDRIRGRWLGPDCGTVKPRRP
jgi:Protein of unknown function (DUF3617)